MCTTTWSPGLKATATSPPGQGNLPLWIGSKRCEGRSPESRLRSCDGYQGHLCRIPMAADVVGQSAFPFPVDSFSDLNVAGRQMILRRSLDGDLRPANSALHTPDMFLPLLLGSPQRAIVLTWWYFTVLGDVSLLSPLRDWLMHLQSGSTGSGLSSQ